MSCLGVLFSIDQKTVDLIKELPSDEERINYVKEVIEEDYFENQPQWVAELVKTWDAMHRTLTDGQLEFDNGEFPLSHVILGGETLCEDEGYIIVLKQKEQVVEIANAVLQLSKEEFSKRYHLIDPDEYDGSVDEEDFEETWEWFEESKEFWQKAAQENRSVLFTVDQ
ncbi:MAG: hypothetical protein JWP58_4157 [Hymenobacter sp.]|nr:hypothetical protein [Hymenobacter sp.]